jgi:CheY-like chemotaxis protein
MSAEKLKVLVVDDEVALAQTMAEALERSGYDVVVAHSGAEGLKILERQDSTKNSASKA